MFRDHGRCQIQAGEICIGRAQEADHIGPLSCWGYTQESNLRAACSASNQWKETKEKGWRLLSIFLHVISIPLHPLLKFIFFYPISPINPIRRQRIYLPFSILSDRING